MSCVCQFRIVRSQTAHSFKGRFVFFMLFDLYVNGAIRNANVGLKQSTFHSQHDQKQFTQRKLNRIHGAASLNLKFKLPLFPLSFIPMSRFHF